MFSLFLSRGQCAIGDFFSFFNFFKLLLGTKLLQEVSAFGEGGTGDTGDVWTVTCDEDFWRRDGDIMLKHVDTGVYLSASGHTFGRPINGQVRESD